MKVSIDDLEADHVTIWSAIALALAGAVTVYGVVNLLLGDLGAAALSGFGILLLGWMSWESSRPEIEGYCDACGDTVMVHSGSDSHDRVVLVRETRAPRRISVGPASLVLTKHGQEHVYCSESCAEHGPALRPDSVLDADRAGEEVSA